MKSGLPSYRAGRGALSALALASLLLPPACAVTPTSPEKPADIAAASAAIVTTCTTETEAAQLYAGTVCGGAFIGNCSPGHLYTCTAGPRGGSNNCTLATTCAIGCLTGPNDTSVVSNVTNPVASDACYTGAAPLSFSSSTPLGGDYVTMTATLSTPHLDGVIVNLQGTTNLVPPLCDVPLEFPAGASDVSWVEPTGVVTSATDVPLNVLLSFNDTSGAVRNLVSVPQTLTLEPGGTLPTPSLATFSVNDANGVPATTVVGGTNVFATGTLSAPAPVGGLTVSVTTSPTSAFTAGGTLNFPAGCADNPNQETLTATSSLTSNLSATITGSTGAGTPISQNVTVTPPALALRSITLTPSTVTGGDSVVATINLNRVVLSSDASSTASVRVSEGNISGLQLATFPGCSGSPACTGNVTIPLGASSTSVTLTTVSPPSQDEITISANAVWSNSSPASNLVINPGSGGSSPPPTFSLTVTASGRSGASIVSSPSGINVTVPNQQTATFNAGTSITLSNPQGRSVIWSGACSSSGKATKSCTFTLNATSSVTANIQ